MQKFTSRAADLIARFGTQPKGSVAMMTGLTFPVLFVAAGGAVDYSNAVTTTQKAQSAMDSTVLALTRSDLEADEVQEAGNKLFRGFLTESGVSEAPTDVTFSLSGDMINGSALVDSQNFFLGYIGLNEFSGRVGSSAVPPIDRPIEIALVLDVSGSMDEDLNGQPRIERLKTAVNGMFDTLSDTLPSGAKVSASVVPYSTSVNLSDFPGALEDVSIGLQPKGAEVWVAERPDASNGNSFVVDTANPNIRRFPFVTAGEINRAAPTARLTPLTENIGSVRAAVNAFTPNGFTAGHIGMAWGVYTLSANWGNFWPVAPEANTDADKIIVFLSDGQFNTTHAIGAQSNDDGAASDAYFQDMCDLAVEEGMTIYTVALALDPVSEQKLGNCVGPNGALYSADDANALSQAFEDIARRLGSHRLTS